MRVHSIRLWPAARLSAAVFLIGFTVLVLGGCGNTSNEPQATHTGQPKFQIPSSISSEHKELHSALEDIIRSGGKTGEAGKVVSERLGPHFEKEELYALPELGLLTQLADGKVSAEMKDTIALSDKLKAELPQMLAEHKTIVAALDDLANTAKTENKPDAVEFTEKLKMHAQNEEEVLYPAAILVGEYLKLRLK